MSIRILGAAVVASIGLATAALAADLPVAPAVVPEADVYNWTGVYGGLDLGYVAANAPASYDFLPFAGIPIDSNPTGWNGGVVLGGNVQMPGGFVLGVEGDIDYGNISATIDDLAAAAQLRPGNTITSKTDWSGSLRGRAGFAVGSLLPYLTAGLAVANTTVSATDGPLSESAVLTGWTAGGGLEYAVDTNWSVKGEVLYTDLGDHTWFSGQLWESTSHSTSTTTRIGVNYRF